MKIKKLPNVLALHLKRFKYQEDSKKYVKLTYRVAFPLELRLFNTVDDVEDPDRLYELFGIVVHIGRYVHVVLPSCDTPADCICRSGGHRKGTRFTTYSYLCAVRTPLDRNERTGQQGQRPRACWCERKALWGPDSGGVGV